jgi:uncharacterized protein YqgV (UPF0045/DUF77 family)
MVITVEISMYPFREDYRELIQEFAGRLSGYDELKVTTGPTATVVVGEYATVMGALTEIFQWSYGEQGRAAFVVKFLPGYGPDEAHVTE